jgi:hypothetical protein
MFGSRFLSPLNTTTVNWDGAGNTNAMILEGQQCLVFYLGGMPVVSNGVVKMTGFSTDALNPTLPGGERIGPFFDFKATRLATGYGAPAGFYNYLDPYGTPYFYAGGTGAANSYVWHSPTLGVSAYQESAGKYTNPNSFQIISAGKNKAFGAGGLWDPTRGSSDLNARDDMSNFSTAVLSTAQN